MRVLNLGCGSDFEGDVRVDFRKTWATTHVFDVEKAIFFDSNYFDRIISKNLLEHLRNVGFFLDECFRVLKPNGTIEIITDNASTLRYYLFGTHTGRYEKKHEGDHHYCIFTKSHLQNHFEKAGFKNIKVEYVETDTVGKWLDLLTFQKPRLEVTATK